MDNLDHVEIGTLSFARCRQEMISNPKERIRPILAVAQKYQSDPLVTAGHAVRTKHLELLAHQHAELGLARAIVTQVARSRHARPG